MNRDTLIAVFCYKGDEHQVKMQMPVHERSGFPIVVLSPANSRVIIKPHIHRHAGRAAYIGQDSLDRQIAHLKILLEYPQEFFLLHDSDSMMLSSEVPDRLYRGSENTIWSNEVTEPRPHPSQYPKLAFQPPYFLSRDSLTALIAVSPRVPLHPITPYIDYAMNAWSAEAGLDHQPFTNLEHVSRTSLTFVGTDPWQQLAYRIRFMGANFVHPIKTKAQFDLCVKAREFYENES